MMDIAILVPVLRRGHQIKPLLKNISETTETKHRVVFLCSEGDPATAICKKTSAETIVVDWEPGPADFAKKINHGFLATDERWLFQGATDLFFHEGWDARALRLAKRTRLGVIGTNDLGNPYVKRGQHATHILFSREYILTYGGTFDNTGVVFSETYDHQYVDTEFVQTAVLRKEFAPCLRSVVEHLHPAWKKGKLDETYEKAMRATDRDRSLFQERMKRMRTLNARRLASAP